MSRFSPYTSGVAFGSVHFSSTSINAQTSCTLLRMASEIRNQIWEFYAADALPPLPTLHHMSEPARAPAGSISLGHARPTGPTHGDLSPLLYQHPEFSGQQHMDYLVGYSSYYPRLEGPQYIETKSMCPALLLTCKKIYCEVAAIICGKVALDFVFFKDLNECWVRPVGRFHPTAIREATITLWNLDEMCRSHQNPRHQRKMMASILSDVGGALRTCSWIERVNVNVHMTKPMQGVHRRCLWDNFSSRGIYFDGYSMWGEWLLRQSCLKTVEIRGCDVERTFTADCLGRLRGRGVKLVGRLGDMDEDDIEVAVVEDDEGVDGDDDWHDDGDDEVDWEAWEEEFGVSDDEKSSGPAFLFWDNS